MYKGKRWKMARVFALMLLLVILLTLGVWGVRNIRFFKVGNIVVTGESKLVSIKDVEAVLNRKYKGQSVFSYNKEDLVNIIASNFPAVRVVSVKLVLPNTLRVDIAERKPFAYVRLKIQGGYYIVDEDGYVLGVSDRADYAYPSMKLEKDANLSGARFDDNDLFVLFKFISGVESLGIKVSTAVVKDDSMEIFSSERDLKVVISAEIQADMDVRLTILDKILRKYGVEGRRVKSVDLRYSNPIIDF